MSGKESLNKFYGIWNLSEWSVAKIDGNKKFPYYGNVKGYLIYHPDNWVSANLMEKNRPELSENRGQLSKLRKKITDDIDPSVSTEMQKDMQDYFLAAHGYISYTGPFEIDDENVHHHIKTSLLPQWIGTTLIRNYSFSNDYQELTLSATQGDYTDKLIWKRES